MATSTCFAASLSRAVIPASYTSQSCKKPYCSLPCSPLMIMKSKKLPSTKCSAISSRSSPRELKSSALASGLWGIKLLMKKSEEASRSSNTAKGSASLTTIAQDKGGLISLVIAVAVPLVLGAANALVNNPNTPFYQNLKKPSYNPPNWLFGLAWGILYPVMGLASWLVWTEGGFSKQAYPLAAYGVQLVLNLLWPAIFFSAHKIGLALIDISALLVAVGVTAVLFKPVNPLAAYLLIPYLAWVAFATFLNYQYLVLNGSGAAGDQTFVQTA